MPEPEWRHRGKIQSFVTTTYGEAVAIPSNPPHATTLYLPAFPDERRSQGEVFRQCRPAADVADNRTYQNPKGYHKARDDEPERTRVLV